MKHELKIWPQYYSRVAEGTKTFELRDNDRAFQFGDTVVLREWDPDYVNKTSKSPKGYTGSPDLEFKIGYIHVLDRQQVIFSLLPLPKSKAVDAKEPKTDKVRNGKTRSTPDTNQLG